MLPLLLMATPVLSVMTWPTTLRGDRTATRITSPRLAESESVFDQRGWAELQQQLDALPVFTCADEAGTPLEVQLSGQTKPLAVFYADVEAAELALAKARATRIGQSLDLIPFPLGKAYRLTSDGEGIIVPSAKELAMAGAPADSSPVGQALPLFACMEMAEEVEGGGGRLPLFMSSAEANAAMAEATAADEPDAKLEMVCLSLQRAIELLVTVPDSPAFRFVPPSSSLIYIQSYLDQSEPI